MLTQCPHCQTIFRVTQDVLAAADGQVRCGRCGAPFDGIKGFVDHQQLLAARRSSSLLKGGVAPAAATSEYAATRPIHNEPTAFALKQPAAKGAESQGKEPDTVAPKSSAPVAAEPAPIPTDSPATRVAPSPPPATPATLPAAAPAEPRPATQAKVKDAATDGVPSDVATDMNWALGRPKKPVSGTWKFVVPPLLVLLCVQIVHYFRRDIASDPHFGPPLIAVYAGLGVELAPHWRLRAYEVRQWGVLANPGTPGTLKVRASITNRAAFAQPYPLLRLVLEDRFGQQVQAREFEASEYAGRKFDRNARLSPNQHIDASLTIVDPGTQAEGFRFDVCLRQPDGVFCADDEPPVL